MDRDPPAGLAACHGAAIDYVRSDIMQLPFEDESFDAVFCISEGALDLAIDWKQVRPVMRRFHGYPYTSVGVALVRI